MHSSAGPRPTPEFQGHSSLHSCLFSKHAGSTRPPAPRTVLRQHNQGSILAVLPVQAPTDSGGRGQRVEVRQQRVEEPVVPSDPPETMCAHSSTAGARICVEACACSASTWHVCAQSCLCTPCRCEYADVYL